MQENRSNRIFIKDTLQYYTMLLNGENYVSGWDYINENVISVRFKKENSYVEQNPTTNVILAAFTTCQ